MHTALTITGQLFSMQADLSDSVQKGSKSWYAKSSKECHEKVRAANKENGREKKEKTYKLFIELARMQGEHGFSLSEFVLVLGYSKKYTSKILNELVEMGNLRREKSSNRKIPELYYFIKEL